MNSEISILPASQNDDINNVTDVDVNANTDVDVTDNDTDINNDAQAPDAGPEEDDGPVPAMGPEAPAKVEEASVEGDSVNDDTDAQADAQEGDGPVPAQVTEAPATGAEASDDDTNVNDDTDAQVEVEDGTVTATVPARTLKPATPKAKAAGTLPAARRPMAKQPAERQGMKFVKQDSEDLPPPVVKQPDPITFDPEQPPKLSNMAEAIRMAQWELVHPEPQAESYVGKLNVWKITDQQLFDAIPPDLSYPIQHSAQQADRDIQVFLAGMLSALSIAICNRFNVIPSNRIVQPGDALNEDEAIEAYCENKRIHDVIMPCFLWVVVIAEMSVGKSVGMGLFLKHIKAVQDELVKEAEFAISEFNKRKAKIKIDKNGKAIDRETGNVVDMDELVKPFKTIFYDNGPTEAALHYALQYNPRGIAYQKDELASLFSAASMYHTNGSQSLLDRMLTAYDGNGWDALRKPDQEGNDASINVPTAAVPIIGGIQPHRLSQFVADNDRSGLSARLTVTRARKIPTQPVYKTQAEICADNADKLEESKIISDRLAWKFEHILNMLMIGEERDVKRLDDFKNKMTPCRYSYPRVIGLSNEALTEYINFRTYLKVSIENSIYGPEEGDFVDRDCDKIIRLAAMFHVWEHCEILQETALGFVPKRMKAEEIAARPISLRTLQRAIVVILYTMQTRRHEFPRFIPDDDVIKRYKLAENIVDFVSEDPRYQEDIPFKDVKILLGNRFYEMQEWSNKALGDFLRQMLCLKKHTPPGQRKIDNLLPPC